ncbi:putative modification methylase NmeDIP [uncultured Spirochaetota bacterium]|nr:putative modification methylase NmeDIP [uncultured Spirochaetota bacterium]
MNNISVFSFFSGSGFLDLGFERSNFNLCFVNEIKPSFLEAYKYSRKKLGIETPKYGYSNVSIEEYLSGDKYTLLSNCIQNEVDEKNFVGFIGGPPCPDFSIGGKNRGKHGDNGKLSGIYVDLISKLKPDFFIFENVKGLWRTKRHREFYEELKERLYNSGFFLVDQLVNSIEFGVPQDRDRIILFGVNSRLVAKPNLLENFNWNFRKKYNKDTIFSLPWPGINNHLNGSNTIEDLPKELTVEYWFTKNKVDDHPNSVDQFTPRAGLEKFKIIAEGDVSKKSFKRLHRYRYSPTACYGNNEVHLHPVLPRRINVAEALAIQSLPKDFELPKEMTLTDKFKTIGNGVPYLLSKGIAETVYLFIKQNFVR